MIGLGSDKNSKFWTASSSKLQSLLSCPLSKQEKEKTAFEVLKSFFVTNKVAKLGVIRMKKFESAWFNRLYDYFSLAQAVYDFLFLLFASSVYSVPALLAPNQVVLKQRESVFLIHECQIQPESYLKDMDGWEHISDFLPNDNLSFDTFYHQIRIVCDWKRRLNWAISWNPTFMQLLWLTQPSGRAEY